MKKLSKTLVSEWSCKRPLYLKRRDNKRRYDRYAKQLKTNGFSDTETWGLDSVIAKFVLPRLIRFKELNNGMPIDFNEGTWDEVLDKMIFAFDWTLNWEEKKYENLTEEQQKENWKRYEEGMALFGKYFRDLWW